MYVCVRTSTSSTLTNATSPPPTPLTSPTSYIYIYFIEMVLHKESGSRFVRATYVRGVCARIYSYQDGIYRCILLVFSDMCSHVSEPATQSRSVHAEPNQPSNNTSTHKYTHTDTTTRICPSSNRQRCYVRTTCLLNVYASSPLTGSNMPHSAVQEGRALMGGRRCGTCRLRSRQPYSSRVVTVTYT